MSSANTVRTIALVLADAEESTTWGRPTVRVGETMFAALHDDPLILRGERETQAERLARDSRLRPAPHWGRDGWIAIALAEVADEELPDLLSDAHQLAGGAMR
jgi:predicted DNA-binding protein (MmcQ/YjbR family)